MKTILMAILCLLLFSLHAAEKGSLEHYRAQFIKAEQGYQGTLIAEKDSLAVKAYQGLQRVSLVYRNAGKLNEYLETREFLKTVALNNSLLIGKTSKFNKVNAVLSALKTSVSKSEEKYQLSIQKLKLSYVAALKKQVIALTQKDKIEEALTFQQEVKKIGAGMSPLASKATMRVKASTSNKRLVLWNTHNAHHNDRGSSECKVSLIKGGKSIWSQLIKIPWQKNTDTKAELVLPQIHFDKVRIDIIKCIKESAGLSEVQLFVADKNIALKALVTTSENFDHRFLPKNLIDGITTSKTKSGYWLTRKKTGWVELTFKH